MSHREIIIALVAALAGFLLARMMRSKAPGSREAPKRPGPAVGAAPAMAGNRALELSSPGNRKIEVIRVVRQATGLGLKEAKDLVDGTMPAVILTGVSLDLARQILRELEQVGARAEIREVDSSPMGGAI